MEKKILKYTVHEFETVFTIRFFIDAHERGEGKKSKRTQGGTLTGNSDVALWNTKAQRSSMVEYWPLRNIQNGEEKRGGNQLRWLNDLKFETAQRNWIRKECIAVNGRKMHPSRGILHSPTLPNTRIFIYLSNPNQYPREAKDCPCVLISKGRQVKAN